MIALMVVFRKSWIEEEKLLFPLTQLPLVMSERDNSSIVPKLFKKPLLSVRRIDVIIMLFGALVALGVCAMAVLKASPIEIFQKLGLFVKPSPRSEFFQAIKPGRVSSLFALTLSMIWFLSSSLNIAGVCLGVAVAKAFMLNDNLFVGNGIGRNVVINIHRLSQYPIRLIVL